MEDISDKKEKRRREKMGNRKSNWESIMVENFKIDEGYFCQKGVTKNSLV